MGHYNKRMSTFLIEPTEQLLKRLPHGLVQIAGRLVRQHDIGRIDERPHNCHPLLFSSREFSRPMMQPITQTHITQKLLRISPGLVYGPVLNEGGHHGIF